MNYLQFLRTFLFSLFAALLLTANPLFSQEQIGGPYTVDDNTLLLLHFDGDLTNESSYSDDGVGHGNFSFFPRPDFGQCLRFDNDALTDSSYVTVPDNDNLDLTGSWTIEGWINIFTFGQSSSDHRWVPRLIIKPGDEAFWQPNYWVELWGDNRWFQVGFHDSTQSYWPAVTSAPNVMSPGQWVHLTFIRDDERQILIQMVHDENRELIWFGTMYYGDLANTVPITTSQDVHIGWAGAVGIPTSSTDSWLDGFVDEIRISNVVRDFPVPPIITSLEQIPNQEASVTGYEVSASVFPFSPSGSIQEAILHYTTDDGATWNEVAFTSTGGDDYTATIPQQPNGTVIKYYMTAEDQDGLTAQYPEEGNDPLSFGIYTPNTQILDITFEEGSGDIIDHSPYNQEVTYFAGPFYSTDAPVGDYAYEFPEAEDSAFFWVDSPFLTAEEFALDYWFKAEGDTILPYIRMIIRPTVPGSHVDQNYYVRTEPNGGISARYVVDPNLDTRTKDNVDLVMPEGTIKLDTWYHVQFERSSEHAIFKIFNEAGDLVGKAYDVEDIALNPPKPDANAPLRVGWAGNSWDGTIRKLNGKMDDIKIYNYAALNMDTTGTITSVDNGKGEYLPYEYSLSQNYPNPFNPTTNIKYSLAEKTFVSLDVYNILGQKVMSLVNKEQVAGEYEVKFDASKLVSGVYIYQITAGNFVSSNKMILLK